MIPFVKEPPTHAIAAIPIASPSSPSMAVRAIELSGEVQIIFIIPPSRNPMISGDCSAAAEIIRPMLSSVELTTGSTAMAIILASGAIARAPTIRFRPSGSFFSRNGATKPTI